MKQIGWCLRIDWVILLFSPLCWTWHLADTRPNTTLGCRTRQYRSLSKETAPHWLSGRLLTGPVSIIFTGFRSPLTTPPASAPQRT
ncbi:hypothetical protein CORC01_05209 [Colletotrichum orchidophilum]|uniref:Secreted protein n=1 Tax=Colletotrichum orchidophilum TaxID=1209926 RepID=A0A1G4BD96_9PEZI|nr:uncharacterized protein CORC01_05209 [Colletotrichum orchidophilum]OHE99409.1 hypothetical protein CORC01_05209 [Colletotrichum orchidophilum]